MNKDLKKIVDAYIKENGKGEITGPKLNNVLTKVIDSLGSGAVFKGVATSTTKPGVPDNRVFYMVANQESLPNFSLLQLPLGIGVVVNDETETGDMVWRYEQLIPVDSVVNRHSKNPVSGTAVEARALELENMLNDQVTALTNRIDSNKKEIDGHTIQIGKHDELINDIDTTVQHNKQETDTTLKKHGDDITALKGVTDAQKQNLDALNTDNETNKGDIKTLTGRVSKNENDISDSKAEEVRLENAKADKGGYYDGLTAGNAENLIGGIDVSQKFYRGVTAGGKSIDGKVARIQKYKGNSVVMNQWDDITQWTGYFCSIAKEGNMITSTLNQDITTEEAGLIKPKKVKQIKGHKYFFKYSVKSDVEQYYGFYIGSTFKPRPFTEFKKGEWNTYKSILTEEMGAETMVLYTGSKGAKAGTVVQHKDIQLIDLTQMFGANNEPSLQEFESWFQLPYYDYNEGTILNYNASGIKSVGFNQWDEEWIARPSGIIAKNKIRIVPNTKYYATIGDKNKELYFVEYDGNGNVIKEAGNTPRSGLLELLPDTRYLTLICGGSYGTKYKNDICINISDPAHNGEYHPYMEATKMLDIQSIKGSDGQPLFPNGLMSAGSVHDEITATKAIKRVQTVDLGTLSWGGGRETTAFTSMLVDKKDGYSNMICSKYETEKGSSGASVKKGFISGAGHSNLIFLNSEEASSLQELTQTLQGVMLNYELAEPIEVDLPNPLNVDIPVENHGTLSVIPEETATPTTAPASLDMTYSMDVVGAVKSLPQAYISKESMENFLGQLGTAQGGTWNMVWDADTGKYNFSFVKTQSIDIPPETPTQE